VSSGKSLVVAIVGGGGKTSLLFALASDARQNGSTVLVTTTTRMYDPRDEQRSFDAFQTDEDWAEPSCGITALPSPEEAGVPDDGRVENGFVCVVGGGIEALAGARSGKLIAVDPELIDAATGWDLILVEADGARHLPLKAPADHEPVLPASSQVVIAVIGLDCLGKPLDDSIAFRPDLVASATGLAPGGILEPRHLAALASAKAGCFKGAPTGAARVLVLNKLDTVDPAVAKALATAVLASGAADLVALTTLGEEDPSQKMALLLKGT
jgi:probable selenium-dependent hydroxylase accessory protein YqeC